METPIFEIAGRRIGPGHGAYIIAEVSANHNHDFDEAVKLIQIAKESGADAVKLQTYTADTITLNSRKPWFMMKAGSIWDGMNLHQLYEQAYTPWDWQPKLKAIAEDLGIALFSSPFDPTAVDFLEEMEVPAYKIASFEVNDLPLIEKIAKTGKPVIMSTGMATLTEIAEAVETIYSTGNRQLALLKCTSAYPSPPDKMNLRTIPNLSAAFNVPVGLSDHTMGVAVPVAAVALGATIIEKHITASRDVPGPDSSFSLEPHEFQSMVEAVRVAEQALGSVHYGPTSADADIRSIRRSLFAVRDIAEGETLTPENVRSIRPGNGLPPRELSRVLGRRARTTIEKGTPLSWEIIG